MSTRPQILTIDDDPVFLRITEALLRENGYEPASLDHYPTDAERALLSRAEAILLDWDLGGRDGMQLLASLRRTEPTVPIVMVTGRNNAQEGAVRAIRAGAFDFVSKPVEQARLVASLTKAVEHHRLLKLIEDAGRGEDDRLGMEGMVGRSPQMRTVFDVIRRVAPTDVSVMITGESGTGKELVARALHRRSKRARGPFVAVNMAALPRELVESTLFGHERGAFTGAEKQRVGVCEEADGGTLFLDELCEMPLELQPKLLRFLQERVFRKVGGSKDQTADVRVVSATNRDPAREVAAGRLRSDLYYRLNVIPVELPALREREGDVPLLALHHLRKAASAHGKSFTSIDPAAIDALCAYAWPGNVRELAHAIERCVVLGEGTTLKADALPTEVTMGAAGAAVASPVVREAVKESPVVVGGTAASPVVVSAPSPARAAGWPLESDVIPSERMLTLEEIERRAIQLALRAEHGSPTRAARLLGISEATIFRKIKVYQTPREG